MRWALANNAVWNARLSALRRSIRGAEPPPMAESGLSLIQFQEPGRGNKLFSELESKRRANQNIKVGDRAKVGRLATPVRGDPTEKGPALRVRTPLPFLIYNNSWA
jgi:hypothetical protein